LPIPTSDPQNHTPKRFPVRNGRFIKDLELFAMPMRFRVRYKDIKVMLFSLKSQIPDA
jgi:hypothetical protein